MCGALNIRDDGTVVFAAPIGDGRMPMIALSDLGWWTRYTLDHREETSGKDLRVASDWVRWGYLSETFTKVTGIPSVYKPVTIDEWLACMQDINRPVANQKKVGDGSTTIRQSFAGFWALFHDDVIPRDMEWVRRTHPTGHDLASWIRETGFNGVIGSTALKNSEDGKARLIPDREVCRFL